LVRIWEKSLTEKAKKLPIILPIVFNHGKRRWKVTENFRDLFEIPPDLNRVEEFLPEFKYFLVDLNKFDDDSLAGEAVLQALLEVFKHIFDKDLPSKLGIIFKKLIQAVSREKGLQILYVGIIYILQTGKLDDTELGQTLSETEEEIGVQAMITVLDKKFAEGKERGFQIGRQAGRQEGLQEGLQQALVDTNMKLLIRKFGKLPKITQDNINALNYNMLQELNFDLMDIKTLPELNEWLKNKTENLS
jgi:hypothetical protein